MNNNKSHTKFLSPGDVFTTSDKPCTPMVCERINTEGGRSRVEYRTILGSYRGMYHTAALSTVYISK